MIKRLLSMLRRPRGPEPAAGHAAGPKPAAVPGRAAPAGHVARTAAGRCGLRPDMTQEQVRQHLATLYRRHNRAAASLDPEVRAEAAEMLDAIIEVRKSLGN